jgi:hypothetical protein
VRNVLNLLHVRTATRLTTAALLATLASLPPTLPPLIAGAAASGAAPAAVRARLVPSLPRVDLARRIGDYVAPFGARRSYRQPTEAERGTLAEGVALLAAGNTGAARAELARVGYTVTTLRDEVTGRGVLEVADASPDREAQRGWGRVYVDLDQHAGYWKPGTVRHWTLQVPHPVYDMATEQVAAAVFRDAPGGIMVVAGAHRSLADPAHDPTTVFAAVIDRLALPGLQVHGFAAESLPDYEAIPTPGDGPVTAQVRTLADTLDAAGIPACRVWERACGDLGGTLNVEGRFAAAHGLPFVHLELAPDERTDPAARDRLATVLAAFIRTWW